jgi:predicted enzyme related to lactoylglutathione lyase
MGERTKYTPGTFSWADLSTTDQDAAKTFYTSLFGWQVQDNPVDENTVYSMMLLDGKPVAAISPQPQQQREAGVPPLWNSYITVESADESAERITQLGGNLHAPPFDVMDVGRMAVAADPGGAFFMVWEPRTHIGAQLVNAPGALSWNELGARDVDAAAQFYSELFGWTTQAMEDSEMPYLVIMNAEGHSNGGIRPVMPPDAPPHWLVYFGSADVTRDLGTVSELGGTALVEPMPIGPGTIAVAQDPQGAVFALYGGQFDD